MSNNTPDYENNLAFAPTSADDLNEQGRQSDVLISAIERCERLEKQLEIAVKVLEEYANSDNWYTENVEGEYVFCFNIKYPWRFIQTALEQIKELDR